MSRLMDVADLPDYSGHPNSPHTDSWDAPDEAATMSRQELIDLACKCDEAALRVIQNEVDFDDSIGGIDNASEEEIAEWYANEVQS